MHRVRWGLTIGWFVLIASLFYDPITPYFTDPGTLGSPFRLDPSVYLNPERCVKIREDCMEQHAFSMSPMIWWAMIVPAGILILHSLGHEFWRRICPLSFLSQIPRALGIQRKRRVIDPVSQTIRYELVTIGEQSWLGRNHLYVQFGLFVLGLGLRILSVNGHRISLGCFLLVSIACAILIGYLYAGKSWCNYFCPMAPVQMIYTGPRALFGSEAHSAPNPGITQSMCRTIDPQTGQERSACVGCKLPCVDIDAEKTYWNELHKPGRRLVQYGYLGMVIAFYFYYYLYSGNWDYYFTGAWTHEDDLLEELFEPGFYIAGHSIAIPKILAIFLTYAVFVTITFSLGLILEKLYRRYRSRQGRIVSAEQAQHVIFTVFTTASFWTFFSYGARPSLNRLPTYPLLSFNALIVLIGAVWFYRTVGRTSSQYERERIATSLQKQILRMEIDPALLEGRSPSELTPDEVLMLVRVLPTFSQQVRLQTYTGVVQDLLEQRVIDPSHSSGYFAKLRQELQLQDADHFAALETIAVTHPELLVAPQIHTISLPENYEITLARTIATKQRSDRTTHR
ncbi:hypothetical protein [Leptolyngbya ohadii]|uniref:hypothetical protein n=1 Tax=Leptolyngbya ohadii TaxID=1962290 RepID=UPI00117A1004|nr:hypothetical protein [Leptolyngbya ohadii]